MYALVNTMDRTDHYLGQIISWHRSLAAAEAADMRNQHMVRARWGQTSYLPTAIVKTPRQPGRPRLQHGSYESVERL